MYPIYKIWIGAGEKIGAKFSEDFTGQRFWPSGKTDTLGPLVPHTSEEWRGPETLEEWFLFIPHPYGQLAVKRLKEDTTYFESRSFPISELETPARALLKAFDWAKTKEGGPFWDQLHDFLRGRKDILPTLENPEPEQKEEKKELIYTLNRPGLPELARTLLNEAGLNIYYSGLTEKYLVFTGKRRLEYSAELWACSQVSLGGYTEVSNADFITALTNLPKKEKEPEKPKEKEPRGLTNFPVVGMDTVIEKNKISIGCQEMSMDDWRDLERRIEDWKEKEISATEEYSIVLTPEGIVMRSLDSGDDYEPIPWETYDTFQNEINYFVKEEKSKEMS